MKLDNPRRVTGVSAAVLAPSLTLAAYGSVPAADSTVYVTDKS